VIVEAGDTATDVFLVVPNTVAEIWTVVEAVAEFNCKVNWREVDPAGILRLDGIVTLAPATLYPSDTVAPPEGAAAVSDTVHVLEPGADKELGVHEIAARDTGRTIDTLPPVDVAAAASPVFKALKGLRI
jgi:hypothetical protein